MMLIQFRMFWRREEMAVGIGLGIARAGDYDVGDWPRGACHG
jgi:hypothetical protein